MQNPFNGFTYEEQETFVNWDYSNQVVNVYTTRELIYNNMKKRLTGIPGVKFNLPDRLITIPIKACRLPYTIIRKPRKAKA